MRYVIAKLNELERENAYRIYVTDGLRAIVNSKAARYADIIKPKRAREKEESAEEIINRFKGKFGGEDGSVQSGGEDNA